MVQQALRFDGQDDHIRLGSASRLGLTDQSFTVEAWVRVDDWGSGDLSVLGTDQTAANIGLHLVLRNRRPYMGFHGNDTPGQTALTQGLWYHLAWRYNKDAGEQAIFVNGMVDAKATGKPPFQGLGDVLVGRWAGGRYFRGQIAELRIWSTDLSGAQLRARMHQRLTGNEPYLTGY